MVAVSLSYLGMLFATVNRDHARAIAARWRPEPVTTWGSNASFWNPRALDRYVAAAVALSRPDAEVYAILQSGPVFAMHVVHVRGSEHTLVATLNTESDLRLEVWHVECAKRWLEDTHSIEATVCLDSA